LLLDVAGRILGIAVVGIENRCRIYGLSIHCHIFTVGVSASGS
jgi:hypothetical protein